MGYPRGERLLNDEKPENKKVNAVRIEKSRDILVRKKEYGVINSEKGKMANWYFTASTYHF